MTTAALHDVISRLSMSAGALVALEAALAARASSIALDPGIQPYIEDTLSVLGFRCEVDEIGIEPAPKPDPAMTGLAIDGV